MSNARDTSETRRTRVAGQSPTTTPPNPDGNHTRMNAPTRAPTHTRLRTHAYSIITLQPLRTWWRDRSLVDVHGWRVSVLAKLPDSSVAMPPPMLAAIAALKLPWKVRDPNTGIVFLLCPPGSCTIGSSSDEEGHKDDETHINCNIKHPFYLAATVTTQAQWERVIGSNPSVHVGAGLPYISGTNTFTAVDYVKGRLMAAHSGGIHNYTSSGGPGSALYTHPNSNFSWIGFAGGQNHIYCAGYSGNISMIYKTTIKADGTALDIPTHAGQLPHGEIVSAIHGYLGYIAIGSNRGIRLATSDADGNLSIGPLLETPNTVSCVVGDSRFFWYGWTNFDSTSTGLGRIDLSQYNSVNEPAYASDLMADVQGAVTDTDNWQERRLFAVSGQGFYREHQTQLASTGYVETGSWRWGIPDPKFATFVDFRSLPLAGSLTFALSLDNGGYESLATFDTQGTTEKTFDGSDTSFGEAAFKITFARSSTDATSGPTLTRWQVRAFPAPKRSELFSVPVLLHEKLNRSNREYYYDVTNELSFLRGLISDTRITTYQEGEETFKVIVENVEWIPVDSHVKNWIFDGTAVITLRSLTA